MNSLCRYITWCVNNEQKNTKVLSVCLQIQFHLSIFTPWAFDQNCLKKPHSSKRTDYLGTLYWAHHKKYTISATSPWKLELIKKQKRSIHYECLGACSRESDLIQQGLLTLHIASHGRAAPLCIVPQCKMTPALCMQAPSEAQIPSRGFIVGTGPSLAWIRASAAGTWSADYQTLLRRAKREKRQLLLAAFPPWSTKITHTACSSVHCKKTWKSQSWKHPFGTHL